MVKGSQARVYLSALIVGLLMLSGAGCEKLIAIPSVSGEKNVTVPEIAPNAPIRKGVCNKITGETPDFDENLIYAAVPDNDSQVDPNAIITELKGQYSACWNLIEFCFREFDDKMRVAYFVLYSWSDRALENNSEAAGQRYIPSGRYQVSTGADDAKKNTENILGIWTWSADGKSMGPMYSRPVLLSSTASVSTLFDLTIARNGGDMQLESKSARIIWKEDKFFDDVFVFQPSKQNIITQLERPQE